MFYKKDIRTKTFYSYSVLLKMILPHFIADFANNPLKQIITRCTGDHSDVKKVML